MKPELSIVIPVYNERENLRQLFCELQSVISNSHLRYEIIFVNDGSTDGSTEILTGITSEFNCAKQILLEANLGQSYAIKAGIEHSAGYWVALIDADLQYTSEHFPEMLQLMRHHDAVFGYRVIRKDCFIKRLSSFAGNTLFRHVFNSQIIDLGCTLRVCKRSLLIDLPYFKNYHRYINLLIEKSETSFIQFPVNHRSRFYGTSKYSIWKFWDVLKEIVSLRIYLSELKSKPKFSF